MYLLSSLHSLLVVAAGSNHAALVLDFRDTGTGIFAVHDVNTDVMDAAGAFVFGGSHTYPSSDQMGAHKAVKAAIIAPIGGVALDGSCLRPNSH